MTFLSRLKTELTAYYLKKNENRKMIHRIIIRQQKPFTICDGLGIHFSKKRTVASCIFGVFAVVAPGLNLTFDPTHFLFIYHKYKNTAT